MPHDEKDKLLVPRRSFFKGAGALALAPFLMSLGGTSSFAAPSDVQKRSRAKNFNTRLVLLGTTGDGTGSADFKICSWRTNDAKNDLSLDEFIELCKKVVKTNS